MSIQHDIRHLLYILLLMPREALVLYDDGTEMYSIFTTMTINEILDQPDEALYGLESGLVIYIKDIREYIDQYALKGI